MFIENCVSCLESIQVSFYVYYRGVNICGLNIACLLFAGENQESRLPTVRQYSKEHVVSDRKFFSKSKQYGSSKSGTVFQQGVGSRWHNNGMVSEQGCWTWIGHDSMEE